MTTPTPPHLAAIRAAENLTDRWLVGDMSDDVVTSATHEDIAQIITREYEPVVKLLQAHLDAGFGGLEHDDFVKKYGFSQEHLPTATKEALNQLTKE